MGASLFAQGKVTGQKDSLKLCHGRVRLYIRRKFFNPRVGRHWKAAEGAGGVTSPGEFKEKLDLVPWFGCHSGV